jgi:uncharacterized membrane protein
MENPIITPDSTEADPISTKKVACGIYIAYLGGIILPMLPLIGIICAYIFEKDAKGSLSSHFQYLIRSFWIGMLYFLISSALIVVLIGIVLVPVAAIWWIVRMIIGLKALSRNEPIVNPKTWLF